MTTTTAPSAIFYTLAKNLERSVLLSYDRLGIADIAPKVIQGHGAISSADECDVCWIALSIVQPRTVDPIQRCAVIPRVTYRIEIWRCWPQPSDRGIVDHHAEAATAAALQTDAAALWYLTQLCAEGLLVQGIPELRCDAFTFQQLRPLGPLGAFAGWTVPVMIDLFGVPLLI